MFFLFPKNRLIFWKPCLLLVSKNEKRQKRRKLDVCGAFHSLWIRINRTFIKSHKIKRLNYYFGAVQSLYRQSKPTEDIKSSVGFAMQKLNFVECLSNIVDNILSRLNSARKSNKVRTYAALLKLFVGELTVSC